MTVAAGALLMAWALLGWPGTVGAAPRASDRTPTRAAKALQRSHPQPYRPTEPTQVVTYDPLNPSGTVKRSLRIAGSSSGSCWISSLTVKGAYRCLSGSALFDPCYVSGHASSTLICVSAPWTSKAWVLRLTATLPVANHHFLRSLPWALQLTSGVRCINAVALNPPVEGNSMPYSCGPTNEGLATFVDESTVPWTVRYTTGVNGPLSVQTVVRVWT